MKNTTRSYYWGGIFLVFISAFFFALKGVFIKKMYAYGIDTIGVLTLRMVFSAPFYFVIIAWKILKKQTQPLQNYQWVNIAFLSLIGYYLSSFMDFQSLNYITASLERVLLFIYPTFVLLINVFRLGNRISTLQWRVLGLTYFGIVLVFFQNIDGQNQTDIFWGAFWVIAAGFSYACYLVGSDKQIAEIGSLNYTCFSMLLATIPTLVHCYIANQFHIWHYAAPVYWLSGVMAIISTVIPTFMLTEGIKRIGSSNTSIINSIGPIFTIVLATVFLNEEISLLQSIGTGFVLLGVFLISWKGKK